MRPLPCNVTPTGSRNAATSFLTPRAGRAALAGLALLTAFRGSTARADWSYVNLHPAGANGSALFGVADGQQVGVTLREDGAPQAARWSGTAGSYVTLNPPAGMSAGYGVSQGKQAGWRDVNLLQNAVVWGGAADSYVNLHPAGTYSSEARGISGNQQVGSVVPAASPPFFDAHASLWTGTAASWVDLHPAGAVTSVAFGVDGNQQVGQATPLAGHGRASLWTGTAASWVDLEPTPGPNTFPIAASVANDVHGGQQVGSVTFSVVGSFVDHAGYWTGTAESWVDLNPDPTFLFTQSRANAVFGGYQVGQADVPMLGEGGEHAAFWNGTPQSWVDLETFLPDHYLGSNAFDVWSDGRTIYVAGVAFNNALNRSEAILWTNTVPEPASAAVLGTALALWLLNARRRRYRHRPSAGTREGTGTRKWDIHAGARGKVFAA
jgi:hypothetical protein